MIIKNNTAYFNWLCAEVIDRKRRNFRNTYSLLLNDLYKTPYFAMLDLDDNRVIDAVSLRLEFKTNSGYRDLINLNDVEYATIFELFVVLARTMDDWTIENFGVPFWFWHFVKTLGLNVLTNAQYNAQTFGKIITIFINRDFDTLGNGGLFPLRQSNRDQRNVQLWDQMAEFVNSEV